MNAVIVGVKLYGENGEAIWGQDSRCEIWIEDAGHPTVAALLAASRILLEEVQRQLGNVNPPQILL